MTGVSAEPTTAASAHVDTFCRDNLPPRETWPEMLFDLPDVQYPPRLNCAVELVDTTIAEHGGDRTALLAPDGTQWSYADLARNARQVAQVLVDEHGLVPGGRVLLRGPNNPWLVASWLGVLLAGGVVVTTMPLLRAGELRTVHEIARVDLAVCDHRFVDDLAAADLGVPLIVYGGDGDDDLTTRARARSGEFTAVDTASDDVALLAFTSGTTGRPKATMHFHRDVLANADTFSRHVLRPTSDDLFTGTPPLAFTFGLGGLVVFPLRAGARSLLVERAAPDDLADLIAEHGVTVVFTAPTAYRSLLAVGRPERLSSLRRCVSAGEHLSAATWQAFHDATGVRIIDGLGSTEMLHIFISAADDDIRPGSTGRPVPGFQATVLDDEGRPLGPGQVGRLAVKGPTGCRYLADPRQSVYVQDGWNVTGDTYLQDDDGYFWYQARSDDMIISSGYNIAAPEVEEALMAHPDVVEVAVIGVPDTDRGHVVKALVVLAEGAPRTAEMARALQDHTKATIAPYKYPRAIEFVDALPRTSTGKLQRFRLRQPAP
ncbi:2-aminobenzoate-CoA ligase [Angustibacter sp. Root456]|nr:2-aminobenzoate-CoA ligase [Angustibacter sp. Root456]